MLGTNSRTRGASRALPDRELWISFEAQTRAALLLRDWRCSRSDGCRLTTPGEEVQAGHHENVGVLEVIARRGVKLLKFLLIGQAHLDDLWAHAAY